MPFTFPAHPDPQAQTTFCAACHLAGTGCMSDLRDAPIRNRSTTFRIMQDHLIGCTFDGFVPGSTGDPDPDRPFSAYREQARQNMLAAAAINFPGGNGADAFSPGDLQRAAWGKVDGDMYEILDAAALWNAAAAWNEFMSTGAWPESTFAKPDGAIATPLRRVAIVKLPRGYDSTRLLTEEARAAYAYFQQSLAGHQMELKLSSPDIVGVRIPDPMPDAFQQFLEPLPNLDRQNRAKLEHAYRAIEGTIEGRNYLFAVAVKTSTRSDRLYQPLFEANVLKFLIAYVLRGAQLRFHVHMETFEGARVQRAYTAASLYSLMLGGAANRAVDHLYQAVGPRDTAQQVLNTFPTYAI